MIALFIDFMERGLLPDAVIRWGVRRLLSGRLASLRKIYRHHGRAKADYVAQLKSGAVAFATDKANQQHYEVPAAFYDFALGPHKKYSCAHWETGWPLERLADAEAAALDITMNRADLRDGQRILELGCGWGSLSLAMAARFPNAKITAISNSNSQREYIEAQARARGFANLEVLTRDLSVTEDLGGSREGYDRLVSVEMFEHLRNYELFFARIAKWLKPGGKMFVHIFTHKEFPYFFETEGDDNWMGKYFFTGGQMPSRDLFAYFDRDFEIERQWTWNGRHYQKTSEAWLHHMDRAPAEVHRVFEGVYGAEAARWVQRWRVFFISCAELFGYDGGNQWSVEHYLFKRRI